MAGFDGILPGENHEPSLTTARPDFHFMFAKMLERAGNWKAEDTGKTEIWAIPFEFVPRESCGCRKRNAFLNTQKAGELKIINLEYTRHIRAMGNFIRTTLSMDALGKLRKHLVQNFAQRSNPYYFAAVLDEHDRYAAKPILHSRHGLFLTDAAYRWQDTPVPDEEMLRADRSVRIVMAQLLQNEQETMGYLISGMKSLSLREQERFEEEALFLSAALNAVIGNRRLAEANNAILKMAEHDYLTGLYNRRGFLRELERRLKMPEMQGKTLTLFSMDMDRLKGINDIYGHQEGDHAIQCLAYGLEKEISEKGICARYGGDEFAFALLGETLPQGETEEIRGRIEKAAREKCGQREYEISASLGACSAVINEQLTLDEILAEADRALYADKAKRKNRRATDRG